MPVYALWNEGLGDHWASINLLAQMSITRREPVEFQMSARFLERHGEILDLLDLGTARVLMTASQSDARLGGFDVWATEYLPTRRRWARSDRLDFICTHFAGVSSAADKNPPDHDQMQIREWAAKQGLPAVELGPHLSLTAIVDLLSRCTLFVGCDSGMSHIAHSVGCPTYLLEYKLPVVTCHRHKAYVLCRGAGHFTQQADTWMHYLRTLARSG